MQTDAMLQKIQNALASDVEFIAWCVATLGAAPTIQIDFDEEQELDVSCYPFVGILSVKHDGRIQQRENVYVVKIVAATRDSALTESAVTVALESGDVSVKTRTYPGRLQAEALREQAIFALYRGQLGKVDIGSDDMSHTYHPKFYSPFTITIEERI